LCDGTNGTPDLRDKFIVGAGNGYAVDANGGSATHKHDFTGNGHAHSLVGGTDINSGSDMDTVLGLDSSLSPYYALAFIMYKGVA